MITQKFEKRSKDQLAYLTQLIDTSISKRGWNWIVQTKVWKKIKRSNDIFWFSLNGPIELNNINVLVESIEACIKDVKDWMYINKLKLNQDKTDKSENIKNSYHI